MTNSLYKLHFELFSFLSASCQPFFSASAFEVKKCYLLLLCNYISSLGSIDTEVILSADARWLLLVWTKVSKMATALDVAIFFNMEICWKKKSFL